MKPGVRKRSAPTPWLKPAVFTGALVPIAAVLQRAVRGRLGANPIAEALNEIGLVTLIFLIATLACTPLKTIFGWGWPVRLRRMLGLFAFFYGALHLSTYAGLDQGLDTHAILIDVTKRKFIFVGFAAFTLMVPLAATSTAASVRRLGAAAWKRLHRLVYLSASLGVVHFVLRVKKDVSEPAVYGVVLGILLLIRVLVYFRKQLMLRRRAAFPSSSPSSA